MTQSAISSDDPDEHEVPQLAAPEATVAETAAGTQEMSIELPDGEATRASGRRTGRTRPSVRKLGNGLVPIPVVEPVNPRKVVLANPVVSEGRRFCWRCGKPV